MRLQWDPERDLHLQALPHRAIQIGLSGEAVQRYVHEWIQGISEVTQQAQEIRALIVAGRMDQATARLPAERPYPFAALPPAP